MPKEGGYREKNVRKMQKTSKNSCQRESSCVILHSENKIERGPIGEMTIVMNDVDDLIFRGEEWICSDR